MRNIVVKAAGLAVAATISSFALVMTVVPLLGGVVEGNAILMSVITPLVVAFPAGLFTCWQQKRLHNALCDLTLAHDRLAEAHMELARVHAQLSEKARLDDMTGLLNREAFFESLKNARRRTDSGVLLIIDADNFKYINDTHGHPQGDVALLLMSEAIARSVREHDLVGRIGGEEFAAFLSATDTDEAMIVAERIRLSVEAIRFSPGEGQVLPLSVSIGASRVRAQNTLSDVMREADRHLYLAKRNGRNRVVFEGGASLAA